VVGLVVSLPAKREQFLKDLANAHENDLNIVVSGLYGWTFSEAESKEQFKIWFYEACPPTRDAEEARAMRGIKIGDSKI
jgi:hypothetical protein